MVKRLSIILISIFFIVLFACSSVYASDSYTIFGASGDIPKYTDSNPSVKNVVPIDSLGTTEDAVSQMAASLNAGQHIVIAGGTGGAVTSSMITELMGKVQANGGSITVVAGINNDQTLSMMQQYLATSSATVPGNGTGNQTPNSAATTYGYSSQPGGAWTGTSITAYNFGQTLLGPQPIGNTTGGLLNYKFPTAPVYVAPPVFIPPMPSIEGSVTPTSGHPGQVLQLHATLGSYTTSGEAKDGYSTVSITSTGNFSYTIPSTAKIGQVIRITFYASNQWIYGKEGNNVLVTVANSMKIDADANPKTVAPTEWSTLSASTTGYANKVSALAQPVNVDGTKSTIACGSNYTLAVRDDGSLYGVGNNGYGQLGTGNTTELHAPSRVQGLSNVLSVSAGDSSSLALLSNGTVWAWGRGTEGELGNGSYNNCSTPVQVSGLTDIVAIASGGYHNLALKKDGTLWTWGYNVYGELGNGSTSSRATPVQVNGLPKVVAIGAGSYHSLAVTYDGSAWAWGLNNYGQLGDNSTINRTIPVQMIGISSAEYVSGGLYHSVILNTDNNLFACGWNAYGQLGTGNTTDQHTPVTMSGKQGTAIAVSGYSTSAIGTDNIVYSVGYNGDGQLGNSTNTTSSSWVSTGLNNVLRIGSGCYDCRTMLAMLADGSMYTWGVNVNGEFGNRDTNNSNKPIIYTNTNSMVKVSQGSGFELCLKSDGTIWAEGLNQYGQLGNGSTTQSYQASQVINLTNVVDTAASSINSYAVKSDGTVWEWGDCTSTSTWVETKHGGYYIYNSGPPVQVSGISSVVSIDAYNGGSTAYVVKSDGTLWSVGPGGASQVNGINNVKSVAMGGTFTLALLNDGTVRVWGANDVCQLGQGNQTAISGFVQPQGLTGLTFTQIAAGNHRAAALCSNGYVYEWGGTYDNNGYKTDVFWYPRVVSSDKINGISLSGDTIFEVTPAGSVLTSGYLGALYYGGEFITDNLYTLCYSPVDEYTGQGGFPMTNIVACWNGGFLQSDGSVVTPQSNSILGTEFGKYGYFTGFYPIRTATGTLDLYGGSISYSLGSTATYTPIKVDFTPSDFSYPDKNNWTASMQVPINAPVGSQLIVTVTAESPWSDSTYSKRQSISTIVLLNIRNKIVLSNPGLSTTSVSPGQTITVTTASTGYALGVTAYGTNPTNPSNPVAFNMSPTTAISTIPKNNTWYVNFTIPSNAPTGAYTIWLVGWNNVFVNQPNSTPLYLNVTVGSPPLRITSVSASPDPVYSHRPNVNLINPKDLRSFSAYNSTDGWQSVGSQQSDGYWQVPRVSNSGHSNSEILMSNQYSVTAGQTYTESFLYKTDGTDSSDLQIVFYTGPRWVAVPATVSNLGNGIKQATATFTINTGETTVRALDIIPPSGNWNNISFANGQLYLSNQNIVTVYANTSGSTDHINISVTGQTETNGVANPYTIALPNMLSSNKINWYITYAVPDNVPDGSPLTFTLNAVSPSGVNYGPVYTAVTVARHLDVTGHVGTQTASPGQVVPIDATTNGYASSVTVQDDISGASLNLSSVGSLNSAGNLWTGNYTIPANAKVGQTITLTYTPKEVNNGTTFSGDTDQKTITIINVPQILDTTFNQTYPNPGANTGAPTGQVDATIVTKGWINSLYVSWDTSYSIPATGYIDADSNGTRVWTVKNLTAPANADVSNAIPTLLNIKGQTPYIDNSTGTYQTVTGTANLPIANTIITKAQQLANPVVDVSTGPVTVTLTVNTIGYATQAWAKTISGAPIQLGSTVTGTIPYSNTFAGTYTIPQGTPSQIYEMPVWATNKTFVNQPDSANDYIQLNIGGLPSMFSASLSPYEINLPASVANRTVNLYAQTTGEVSGVQVSLSINGGPSTILPTSTMAATSGSVPNLVTWQGAYVVDPNTPDGTELTFTFQALDNRGTPQGPTVTPHFVTIHYVKPPTVVITH